MLAGIVPMLGAQLLFLPPALWASRAANVLRLALRACLPLYFALRDTQITGDKNSGDTPGNETHTRQHSRTWLLSASEDRGSSQQVAARRYAQPRFCERFKRVLRDRCRALSDERTHEWLRILPSRGRSDRRKIVRPPSAFPKPLSRK